MNVHPALYAAPLIPILCGAAALAAVRINRRNEALQRRVRSVTGPEKAVVALPSIQRFGAGQKANWKDHLASLFGFSLAKTDLYPVKWPLVILVTLGIGRVVVALLAPLVGSLAWLAMPVACIMLTRTFFARATSKRQLLLREQLPDALSLIVRAIRVGVSVPESLTVVARESPAPTGVEFKLLADQIAIGVSLDTALRTMATRNDLPEYAFFAAALGLQAQTGGGLSETLDLLAAVTRKRVALRARGRALSSEARTSAIVLAAMPVIMVALLSAISPDYKSQLFDTGSGNMMLGASALLLVIGGLTMQTIIRKSLA